ncbi:hypothetical protein BSKO_06078 [Bryopsis sp. KO-2023]|nr:hypothetical protein BSKO_06078 [Bryopsis sp. KO-2023]
MHSTLNGTICFSEMAAHRAPIRLARPPRATMHGGLNRCGPSYRPLWTNNAISKDRDATSSGTEIAETATLYDLIGGADAVDATVDCFYGKVYSDDRVNKWFDGISPVKQGRKMKTFLTASLQGLPYKRDMTKAHAKLVKNGMADFDFDVIEELMGAALQENGVEEELASKVISVVESTREAVLGRAH